MKQCVANVDAIFPVRLGALGSKQGKCNQERVVAGSSASSHAHYTSCFCTSEFQESEIGNFTNKDIYYCYSKLGRCNVDSTHLQVAGQPHPLDKFLPKKMSQ